MIEVPYIVVGVFAVLFMMAVYAAFDFKSIAEHNAAWVQHLSRRLARFEKEPGE